MVMVGGHLPQPNLLGASHDRPSMKLPWRRDLSKKLAMVPKLYYSLCER